MKWKKAYNFYLISSGIMIVLLVAMGIFVIYPALKTIIAIKAEISAQKSDLENKLSMGLNANRIKEELVEVENQLSILDSVFIPQGKELTLLADIEAMAARNNVKETINPDFNGVNIGNGVTRNAITIRAQGTFKNLMAFLNEIDSSNFYLVSDKFTLTKGDKDSLSLNMEAHVFIKSAQK